MEIFCSIRNIALIKDNNNYCVNKQSIFVLHKLRGS
ncbi:hypothetical protein SAMN05519226_2054 [Cycloclasticus pugetii]|nr:hypothetical protein SAMN05519226_2054 [Cycloclasticus pugetii]